MTQQAATMLLGGLRVLIVDDDVDFLDGVAEWIALDGATVFRASTAASALELLASEPVDAMVVDVRLGTESGVEVFARARALGSAAPAIGVTAHPRERIENRGAGFAKWLHKPFEISDLVVAISSLCAPADARAQLRKLLSTANAETPYRFTSLFRFDGESLTSVWSFDRENPLVDDFPFETKVQDSYCCFVRAKRAPFVVTDALGDPRVAGHPKQRQLRSYCGVPVHDDGGNVVGSLCHFDTNRHEINSHVVDRLNVFARDLETGLLARLAPRSGVRLG